MTDLVAVCLHGSPYTQACPECPGAVALRSVPTGLAADRDFWRRQAERWRGMAERERGRRIAAQHVITKLEGYCLQYHDLQSEILEASGGLIDARDAEIDTLIGVLVELTAERDVAATRGDTLEKWMERIGESWHDRWQEAALARDAALAEIARLKGIA